MGDTGISTCECPIWGRGAKRHRDNVGRLTVRREIKIRPRPETRHHAKPRLHKHRGHHEHVHPQAPAQQGQQRPLMAIVRVHRGRPGRDEAPQQGPHRPARVRLPRRRAHVQPPAVPALGDGVQAQLAGCEAHDRRGRRGQHEPRAAAQGAPADARERGLLAALAAEAEGLERAHVARHQREDGVADAALDEDPEVR